MLKGLLAAAVALIALAAAVWFSAAHFDRAPADFVRALGFAFGPMCLALAALATLFSALSLIAVFAAFAIDEEPGHRRPARPFAITALFAAIGLVFAAYWSMRDPQPEIAEPPPSPSPAEPPPPVVEPAPGALLEPEPSPDAAVFGTGFSYAYAYPRLGATGPLRSPDAERALDEVFGAEASAGEKLLCGKAWVAFAGAASEEGPRARNDARARARAAIAVERAARWLDRQDPSCARPALLGVDLGQHAPTGRGAGDGALTAYQRDLAAISRKRLGPEDSPTAEAALAELEAFLASPSGRAAVEDGRTFLRPPVAFIP